MFQSIGILGGGESGVGAALLAKEKGYNVFLSDGGVIGDVFRSELNRNNIPFEEKGHTIERLDQMDVIVKSPGIPVDAAVVTTLREKGVRVISEIEWGFLHCPGKILGITGSNGKTTTTMLCHHLLIQAGMHAAVCGNVGTGFCRTLLGEAYPWYVVEISSFQLDDIETFHPEIGILLNITPDHLNRYDGDLMKYAAAKMQIARFTQPADTFIYNAGDALILQLLLDADFKAERIGVVAEDSAAYGIPSDVLPGRHNALNAACAIAAVKRVGVPEAVIQDGLKTFARPAHRMEFIAEINGVRYINDSKATNVDSVYYALDAAEAPVIWIAGGQDKGNDYTQIEALVRDKVTKLICLGIDNKNLLQAFSSKVAVIEETTSMFEAVSMAASNAPQGATVLLSPACASFDLFRNYMHRGDVFREEVLKLKEEG